VNIFLISTSVYALRTLADAWLSGDLRTDAEGSFTCAFKTRAAYTLGFQIIVRFLLDQKDKSVLEKVKVLFKTGRVSARLERALTVFLDMKLITRPPKHR